MQRSIRRRSFLKAVGAGAAGVAALGRAGIATGFPANDTIRVGVIGSGGRAQRALMPAAAKVPGVELVSVCDVYDKRTRQGLALCRPGASATRDHHAVLARDDIDAVIVATADHWHVPITIDACRAGKDVYVEKPLTHKASEGKAVIAAQNEHQRIVQVGMQQRSMPHFKKGLEIVRSGELGTVHKVHLTWNRNHPIRKKSYGTDPGEVDWQRWLGDAPSRPFDEWVMLHFRWHWEFGGGILTDLMVHYIDVVNWYLGLDHPETAVSIGDHFQSTGVWETPDTIQTLLHYPKESVQVYFEGTFSNARNGAMLEFMGTKATLYLDRGHCEVHPERVTGGEVRDYSPGKSHRGADFDKNVDGGLNHMQDFFNCVRSRGRPVAPAEAGVAAVTGAHLGNLAYRSGGMAQWSQLDL
jgi:predicted dehydrogenase